jgi:hypothetical protein
MSSKDKFKELVICFHPNWKYSGIYHQFFQKMQINIRCLNPECLDTDELVLDLDFFFDHY